MYRGSRNTSTLRTCRVSRCNHGTYLVIHHPHRWRHISMSSTPLDLQHTFIVSSNKGDSCHQKENGLELKWKQMITREIWKKYYFTDFALSLVKDQNGTLPRLSIAQVRTNCLIQRGMDGLDC